MSLTNNTMNEIDRQEFDGLKAIGWKQLSKDQRKRYSELKAMISPAKPSVVSLTSVPLPALTQQDTGMDILQRLHATFGGIKDADDKSKVSQMIQANELPTLTKDQVFEALIFKLADGDSRACLRRYFDKQ